MYFSAHTAYKALKILAAAGLSAEIISASRPSTGVRYLLSVDAHWLPQIGKETRTVQIRTPRELSGYGATAGEVADMLRAEGC